MLVIFKLKTTYLTITIKNIDHIAPIPGILSCLKVHEFRSKITFNFF